MIQIKITFIMLKIRFKFDNTTSIQVLTGDDHIVLPTVYNSICHLIFHVVQKSILFHIVIKSYLQWSS